MMIHLNKLKARILKLRPCIAHLANHERTTQAPKENNFVYFLFIAESYTISILSYPGALERGFLLNLFEIRVSVKFLVYEEQLVVWGQTWQKDIRFQWAEEINFRKL
jgi:hypothetical protein